MKIKITARKFKARDGLKDFIHDELAGLAHHHDEILDIEAVLSFQNSKDSIKTAELIVKVPGQIITASDSSDEFEKAIRSASEKVMRQLAKIKTKRKARKNGLDR